MQVPHAYSAGWLVWMLSSCTSRHRLAGTRQQSARTQSIAAPTLLVRRRVDFAQSRPLAPLASRLQNWRPGVVVRILCLIPAAAALLTCACADPYVVAPTTALSPGNWVSAGNWRIERQTDRVTGKPISSALLVTRNSSSSESLVTQNASMQIGCFMGQPLVKFGFANKVGTDPNSFLGYRFDDKPGHEIGARFLQKADAVVIEDKAEVAQFIGEMATSHSLYVRLRSLNAGRTSAEFTVDGAKTAIEAALAECPAQSPMAAAPPQAAPQAKPRTRRPSAWSRDTTL